MTSKTHIILTSCVIGGLGWCYILLLCIYNANQAVIRQQQETEQRNQMSKEIRYSRQQRLDAAKYFGKNYPVR